MNIDEDFLVLPEDTGGRRRPHPYRIILTSSLSDQYFERPPGFTAVPALKFGPAGVTATPPVPVPALFTVGEYYGTPAWLIEKILSAMVKVPDFFPAVLLGQ
jgi:hypothetical protein